MILLEFVNIVVIVLIDFIGVDLLREILRFPHYEKTVSVTTLYF